MKILNRKYEGEIIVDEIRLIEKPEQLSELKLWPLPFFRPDITVKIETSEIPQKIRDGWEKELDERMSDCGCHLAAFGFILGVLVYLIWIFAAPVKLSSLTYSHLLQVILTAIAGLFIGKMSGLILSRRKLSRTFRKIQKEWTDKLED